MSALLAKQHGSTTVMVHGTVFRPAALPGFIAGGEGQLAGLLTYDIGGDTLEIVTLDVLRNSEDTASALLEAAVDAAIRRQLARLVLTTTNDNLDALRFYQTRGFRLAALRVDAVAETRRFTPCVPAMGRYGIPRRDELDLERMVRSGINSD